MLARWALAGAAFAALAGCKSIEGGPPVLASIESLASAAVVAVDPLAPTWHIEERALGAGRYAFELTKKLFAAGGDGEAMPALRRRIEQIAAQKGYTGHVIVEYTEGIGSRAPIGQRSARALVHFSTAPLAEASGAAK